MGQGKSKPPGPMGGGPPVRLPPIPPDSPLGLMLKNWRDFSKSKGKNKAKMIHFCMEIWGGQNIKEEHVCWPIFGSFENWVCEALNTYVNSKEPVNPEESDYANMWMGSGAKSYLFALKEKGGGKNGKKKRDKEEVPLLPPPYIPPPPPIANPPPSAPEETESDSGTSSDTPRSSRRATRSQAKQQKLYPLRETPMGGPQPGIGFVSIPLNSGDVREFKKEMGNLIEDPLGVAERIDQFLGPNTYTWDEMQSILSILFTAEERNMIRRAGMRIWDAQHVQGPFADEKWPIQRPNWDHQNPNHRTHMQDLRTIIIQGIRESVPRGQNINKAFNERQKKEESPTDWLERLRKSLQMYSGLDPDTQVGQALLKTQFVAKSWDDIRKKLEKMDNWQDRGLDELLREAQKVYVRRDDENHKKQVRMMVAAVREGQKGPRNQTPPRTLGKYGDFLKENPRFRTEKTEEMIRRREQGTCFYCGARGHIKRECRKRLRDERMFKED